VSVSLDNLNRLQITSQLYGATSSVGGLGGTALSTLGFTGNEVGVAGTDVAGEFVVNGVSEAATGSGQVLKGNAGNANTDGLQVLVTLTAPGSGNLTVTRGIAAQLEQVINKFVDPVNGRLATIDQGFQDRIADIRKAIARQNDLVSQQQASLTRQFAAMEAQISQLKAVGQTVAQFGVLKFQA
jgi:flagellar hook-associated protein 2